MSDETWRTLSWGDSNRLKSLNELESIGARKESKVGSFKDRDDFYFNKKGGHLWEKETF